MTLNCFTTWSQVPRHNDSPCRTAKLALTGFLGTTCRPERFGRERRLDQRDCSQYTPASSTSWVTGEHAPAIAPAPKSSTPTGAIVGAVVGGIVGAGDLST